LKRLAGLRQLVLGDVLCVDDVARLEFGLRPDVEQQRALVQQPDGIGRTDACPPERNLLNS